MNELNQLLLNFDKKKNFNYKDFFVSESNFFAFKIIDNWPKWERNIINIFGEKSCGKTHLSQIFSEKFKAIIINETDINDEIFRKLKIHENIVLDNFENKIEERLIYSLMNLIDQDNKYMIINSKIPVTKMKFKLKDLNSRLNNCILAEIKQPNDELIFALLIKNFSDRQIRIEKRIIEYIVKRIDRSYGKINEFIYKVDEISLKKKKPIDLKIIKQIIKE
tara:strand:- start:309 stop:971 length:663 start_codon:yes stop_codon:yes gene_type:complete